VADGSAGRFTLPAPVVRAVDTQARAENFPVALRVLPSVVRADLSALYRYARLVDDLGDVPAADLGGADRSTLLDAVAADVRSMHAGQPAAIPSLAPVGALLARRDLPLAPFLDLVEANRRDQVVRRYATWDELSDYCALSANPVGRLVLGIFGVATDDRIAWSDSVCTALQLIEHLQDIGEDYRERDRVYLPVATMAAHGVTEGQLAAPVAGPPLRAAVAAECDRARSLLAAGRPLVGSLHGAARLAVAGFVAGGLAAVAAIERADHEVLGALRSPARRRVAREAFRLWRRS
jgi:squalene synthase HpnC